MGKPGEELAKVLHYYGFLKGSSSNDKFKVLCPFHADQKPSMMIDLKKGTFFCFGCQKSGVAADFIKLIEGVDSLKAWILLPKILKSNKVKEISINYSPKVDYAEMRRQAEDFFFSLPQPSWKHIKNNYMIQRGFLKRVLIDQDIRINQNDTYPIIAPIYDMGRFKGYVCRADKDVDRKYLYNTGFNRKNVVVGNYKGPWVFVTEGYMDWLKGIQFGIHNSAALLGWKPTDRQIEKLKKHTDTIISGLDNTETGEEGTKILRQHFKVIRFRFPENAKDIGELDLFDFRKSWEDTWDRVQRYEKKKQKRLG